MENSLNIMETTFKKKDVLFIVHFCLDKYCFSLETFLIHLVYLSIYFYLEKSSVDLGESSWCSG